MTFSDFVQILKSFANETITQGRFVLDLFDKSLEDVSTEDEEFILKKYGALSYNPIRSEEIARKYFDGRRKISRQNFRIIEKHFERNKFVDYLTNTLLKTDDNYRHLDIKLKQFGFALDENDAANTCADIFDEIIATADKEYKKPSEKSFIKDESQEQFKNFIFEIFNKLVISDSWPFKCAKYKIFKDELYELVHEDIDERFDIAVENYNGENSIPAIKLLIKCKKSVQEISKDDLRIFNSKVKDVSGCCKGLFITNSFFSEDALYYANSVGLGLLRIFDDESIKWLAPRKMQEPITFIEIEKCENEIRNALLQEDYEILNNFAVGFFGKYYSSISSIVGHIFTNNDFQRIENFTLYKTIDESVAQDQIKFLSIEKIKEKAKKILFDIYGKEYENNSKVEIKDLVLYLKRKFQFSVEFPYKEPSSTFPEKIQGLVDYKNKKILIYGIENEDLHLLKFSIAHEISHLILHESLLEKGKDNFYYFYKSTKESKRVETQANMLASYIILQDKKFKDEFLKLVKINSINPKNGHYLYLDNQKCNVDIYLKITESLINIFDVSREQIKYRLKELGWLEEPVTNPFTFF